MKEIALCSILSVIKLVLVVLVGVWLGRKGILDKPTRQHFSKILMTVMLPSLLIVSLGRNAQIHNIGQWWMLVVSGGLFVLFGFLVSELVFRFLHLPEHLHRGFCAATAFGNSSYLPLPLMMTITATAPVFLNDATAGERSFAYISVYLLSHSPLLWLIGFPYLSGKSIRELKWNQIISPPLVSSFIGLMVGAIPWLNKLFFGNDAPFGIVVSTMEMIGKAIFPLALMLLGSNLSEKLPTGEKMPLRSFVGVTACRLVLMPIIGFATALLAWWIGLGPKDPLFYLVIMTESAVPAATNLIVMTQVHHKGEATMARILLCEYCMAVPILTITMTFFLYTVSALGR